MINCKVNNDFCLENRCSYVNNDQKLPKFALPDSSCHFSLSCGYVKKAITGSLGSVYFFSLTPFSAGSNGPGSLDFARHQIYYSDLQTHPERWSSQRSESSQRLCLGHICDTDCAPGCAILPVKWSGLWFLTEDHTEREMMDSANMVTLKLL